jgi:hypothetical protein
MKVSEILNEGIFDAFKKKPEPKMLPVSPEQRALIKQYFPAGNADTKYGNGSYVLPLNVNTNHGKGRISFRNEDGVLKASIAYHGSEHDAINPRAMPVINYDVEINSPADMEKLKAEL